MQMMIPTWTVRRVLLAGAALAGVAVGHAHAAGFYIGDPNARASGRAFSGEAADMGGASLFYNPAAIAGVDRSELTGSVTVILVDGRVSDSGSTITQGGVTTPIPGTQNAFKPVELGVVPSSDAVLRINDQFSVGLAVSSPFSFATKYDDNDTFVRYDARTTRLTTIDVQPTLAWRPLKFIGIGVGPVIEYANAVLNNALPQLTAGQADGFDDLHGNGYAAGYAVGLQLHPTDTVTIGGAYRSEISHTLTGLARIQGLQGILALGNTTGVGSAAAASFNTPYTATFSVRWRVTPQLTLEGQGVRFGWSDFNQITLSGGGGLLPNFAENYHDTTSGALGFDYDVTPRFTVRGGIQYDPTPTPNIGRDARVPDGDRFLFAGGYSFKVTPRMVFEGSVQYVDFIPSHISHDASQYGNISPLVNVPINVQGEIHANAETLSVGSHFYF